MTCCFSIVYFPFPIPRGYPDSCAGFNANKLLPVMTQHIHKKNPMSLIQNKIMKLIIKIIYLSIVILLVFSCSLKTETNKVDTKTKSVALNNTIDCGYEDGTYQATVVYKNSKTGYSTTYTLDVEVEDCQVVQINFPNGGHLDSDHILSGELDESGSASIKGEIGKSYEVHLEE